MPFGSGLGRMSGRVPSEQQTRWPGCRVEQRLGSGLYFWKVSPDMPHLSAKDPQLSPDSTVVVLQSLRRKTDTSARPQEAETEGGPNPMAATSMKTGCISEQVGKPRSITRVEVNPDAKIRRVSRVIMAKT